MEWFKSFRGLFATEKARTIIKIEGNKLNCIQLDAKGKPSKRYELKFKHSNKLKKFWERYMRSGLVEYYPKEKIYFSTRLLNIAK